MRDDKLLDYLKSSCHGRENRKSGRELARTLGINVKDLQKLVKRLRKKKNPMPIRSLTSSAQNTANPIHGRIWITQERCWY